MEIHVCLSVTFVSLENFCSKEQDLMKQKKILKIWKKENEYCIHCYIQYALKTKSDGEVWLSKHFGQYEENTLYQPSNKRHYCFTYSTKQIAS